jgi:alanine-glyoxylate transaminase/serine-glyoxylate transaminase/serine-pyruvate transaminase
MNRSVIDHRGPEFAKLAREVVEALATVFQTRRPVVVYPSSGSGAWEAAIVNTLSAGDRIVLFETGHFSQLWRDVALRFGLAVDYVPGNWRRGASANELEALLSSDSNHLIKAVLVVHNETSTGTTSDVAALRRVMDRVGHSALLMVDAISSLGCMDYRHDEWQVDVTIAASQKGLMLPPGLSFHAVSDKALRASKSAKLPKFYWDWNAMLQPGTYSFPYTPATTLLYGLQEAIAMLHEEGLQRVFARHRRYGEATRAAVQSWGLDIVCQEPREYSDSLTAVFVPEGHDADQFRAVVLEHFDMSLGAGLAKLARKVFRIGHLGHFNDLMLVGTLGGVEMGLELGGIPHRKGGLAAALDSLVQSRAKSMPAAMAPSSRS